MEDRIFYEEDGNEIIDAIAYMVEHTKIPRMDVDLEGNKKALVYWTGATLRIDIQGLRP